MPSLPCRFHHVEIVLQPLTQLGGQRILDGFRQIGHFDLGRVNLPAGAAGSHHRDLEAAAV